MQAFEPFRAARPFGRGHCHFILTAEYFFVLVWFYGHMIHVWQTHALLV